MSIFSNIKFKKLLYLLLIVCLFTCLISADCCFAKKKKKGAVEVETLVRDGFHIISKLDMPKTASIKNKVPLVVFMHSIGEDANEWGTYPETVKEKLNVATLRMDFRGHGKSIINKKGKKVYWQYFVTNKEYQKFPYDVIDVLKNIKEQYPEIDTSRVSFVGSSLGANIALMAGSYGTNAKSIVMLSPMLNYKGFDLRLPIVKYGEHPLLFIVSKDDVYPYSSCKELIKFAQGKKMLKVYPTGGTGTDLLKFKPDARTLTTNWIQQSLNTKSTSLKKAK
jgi:predicted esterase